MNVLLRAVTCLVLVATLGGMTGCGGPGGFNVTGKLTQGGAPVTVSDKGVIQMNLVPVDDTTGAKVYPVTAKPDGSFVVNKAGDGSTPSAGKYRVSVKIVDPYPGKDKLKDKYFGPKSTLVQDITGSGEIVINLPKD